jgi:glucokinase
VSPDLQSGAAAQAAMRHKPVCGIGHAVAVDLGGTKAAGAISDPYGKILAERTEPTSTESTPKLVRQLRQLARRLAADAGVDWPAVRSMGIGVPGVVDPVTGAIGSAPNIPDLSGISFAEELAASGRDLRVLVDNDVNLAAIGERWRGWGQDCDHFAFLAIGTGIGAGVVVNGDLYRGFGGAAGEVAYLPLGSLSPDPEIGPGGVLEDAVGGAGMVAHVARRLALGDASELRDGCSAADICAAAARGDRLARASVDREARLVATAIASVSAVLAPELVVLGGGIGANPLLLEPVRRHSHALTPQPPRIEQSTLGARAAMVGALWLALQAGLADAPELPSAAVPTR